MRRRKDFVHELEPSTVNTSDPSLPCIHPWCTEYIESGSRLCMLTECPEERGHEPRTSLSCKGPGALAVIPTFGKAPDTEGWSSMEG